MIKNLLKDLSGDNLLYFAMFSLVVTVSFSTSFVKNESLIIKTVRTSQTNPLPILKNKESFPTLSAQGVLAVDVDSGVYLYEKNGETPLLPASTTKIVTALVAIDYYDLDSELVVPEFSVVGQKMGLIEGEVIAAEDLLQGLLIQSANDAAEVLARNYLGGRDAFMEAMNMKAKQLKLANTHFVNPSGLEDVGHVSTARDLVRVGSFAMKNPIFAKIVRTPEVVVTGNNGEFVHKLKNLNTLLGSVDGVVGIKTGWTENARENLVTYIERDGRSVVIALLGSQDRFGETRELINWIFENFEWINANFAANYSDS